MNHISGSGCLVFLRHSYSACGRSCDSVSVLLKEVYNKTHQQIDLNHSYFKFLLSRRIWSKQLFEQLQVTSVKDRYVRTTAIAYR